MMSEREVYLSSPGQPHINGKPHATPHLASEPAFPSCLIGSSAYQTTYSRFSPSLLTLEKSWTQVSCFRLINMTSTLKQPTFLRVKGTDIVDGDGNRVILKGVRAS